MIVAVLGTSLARGDARGTTGSDGLAEHLGRWKDDFKFFYLGYKNSPSTKVLSSTTMTMCPLLLPCVIGSL